MHRVIERGEKLTTKMLKIQGIGHGVKKWKDCLSKTNFPPQHGMSKIVSLWSFILQLERYSDYA